VINTFSKFYYGIEITDQNYKIDFDEGAGELTAILNTGTYTPTEIAAEVEAAMNAVGSFTYSATFNRSTRRLTITSSASMTMLFDTGSTAPVSAFTVLGFGDETSDDTDTSFVAGDPLGSVYLPQYILQSYVPLEHFIEQLHQTVNETITGRQELITYGDMNMMRCNITFITDITQPSGGPIMNSSVGVADAISFMRWCCKKNKVEFMPDTNTASAFFNLVLDSSTVSKDGTTFRLKELYDRGLSGYYETETLTFRKVD
jgi:hypothetical protein